MTHSQTDHDFTELRERIARFKQSTEHEREYWALASRLRPASTRFKQLVTARGGRRAVPNDWQTSDPELRGAVEALEAETRYWEWPGGFGWERTVGDAVRERHRERQARTYVGGVLAEVARARENDRKVALQLLRNRAAARGITTRKGNR